MPGIFGLVRKGPPDRDAVAALLDAMRSRLAAANPDFESAAWAGGRIGLGRVGLPLPGVPRFAAAADGAAALGGFVYGWRGLDRQPDAPADRPAERLLAIARAAPDRLTGAPDGSFQAAVAWSDAAAGAGEGAGDGGRGAGGPGGAPDPERLMVWNDRLGHRLLYWYEDREILLFAAELKALLAWPGLRRELDLDAVADYFNYGYPLGETTFLRDVRVLPAGHALSWRDGEVRLRAWAAPWRFEPVERPLGDLVDELDALYPPLLARRLQPEGPIALPLSGGLDSRFILGHLRRLGRLPRTFTHGKPGCLDARIAVRLARAAGVPEHRPVAVRPRWLAEQGERYLRLIDGMCHLPPATLLAVGAEYGLDPVRTCFLNGIFGGPGNYGDGYFNRDDLRDDLDAEARRRSLRRTLFGTSRTEAYYAIFRPELGRLAHRRYDEAVAAELERLAPVSPRFCDRKDAFFMRNRLRRHMNQVDCNRHLWHDHFALADDALLDFYLRLPAELKVGRRLLAEYFRRVFPDLAAIPWQATGVDLYHRPSPARERWRQRRLRWGHLLGRLSGGRIQTYDMRRYYHWDQWYRTEPRLRSWIEGVLRDRRTRERGLYEPARVEAVLRYQRRGGQAFSLLGNLVSVELSCRLLLDGPP